MELVARQLMNNAQCKSVRVGIFGCILRLHSDGVPWTLQFESIYPL